MTLRATLVTDGTSDIVLVPVLQWLIRQLTPAPLRTLDAFTRLEADTTAALAQLGVAVPEAT